MSQPWKSSSDTSGFRFSRKLLIFEILYGLRLKEKGKVLFY